MQLFEAQFHTARWRGRFSECALLRSVSDNVDADPRLRINAQVRAGHALSMAGRKQDALELLEDARGRVETWPAAARSN